MTGCERIGHGGASRIERANTLASFDAARRLQVDVIEFDVRAWRGELVLAHTLLHAGLGARLALRSALAHLARPQFDEISLHLDLKHTGSEPGVLAELRRSGLLERTLICSQLPAVVDAVRALEPAARVGISIGGPLARASHRWRDWHAQALDGLAQRRWDALMANHKLIDGALLDAVNERQGRLYAWTVNERTAIEALRALGVHGIASGDPRLFA